MKSSQIKHHLINSESGGAAHGVQIRSVDTRGIFTADQAEDAINRKRNIPRSRMIEIEQTSNTDEFNLALARIQKLQTLQRNSI